MATKRSVDPSTKQETRLEGFASICGVLILGLFALTFIFENFVIPSSSMASTLKVGDHVMVDRERFAPSSQWTPFLPYQHLKRGDVVVFYKPIPEADGSHPILVKRLIAIPGDRIHLRDGIVYLNGVAQSEPQAGKPTAEANDPYKDNFPSVSPDGRPDVTAEWGLTVEDAMKSGDLLVPPGQYFVMGDNREFSLDSRCWGFVPRANFLGKPLFVYWSFDLPENNELKPPLSEQAGTMAHEMLHFFSGTRWSRTLHPVQ
jgi:signal peptidase I